MVLQKRFNDPQKQFVDPYWTIISGVLSHGRGRSKLTLDRAQKVSNSSAEPVTGETAVSSGVVRAIPAGSRHHITSDT